jgi:PilZ domain-containing protein
MALLMREREPDLRRHPRARVTWPVTVDTGDKRFDLETINLSPFGAKLRLDDPPFEPGSKAQLHFRPPGGRPLDVLAIVWRADRDGPAFFFIGVEGGEGQDFIFPTDAPEGDSPRC